MSRGFTILELLAAILVIAIGVLSAYTVTQQIIAYTFSSASRLTGAYLAKEGIEIIRNIRDTNWLEGAYWRDGIFNTSENNVLLNYNRETTISSNPDESINVSVEVSWDIRGDDGIIIVQENLYDWK